MFTTLYLQTTNPELAYVELISRPILSGIIVSIVFHTILYVGFANIASYIFFGRALSASINTRLVLALLLIMMAGFIGRLVHVKEMFGAYGNDMKKTREHIDKHYISWVFLS